MNIPVSPGHFTTWKEVPVFEIDNEGENAKILANQGKLRFSADSSLSEKVQRVFNNTMFCIVGATLTAQILNFIPALASAGTALSGLGLTAISGISLLQIPVVAAIIAFAPKIILAVALVVVIRKVLTAVIYHFVYPATHQSKKGLDTNRLETFNLLTRHGIACRRVTLNKSGINYDAFTFESPTTKGNGQWVIIAGGNNWVGEKDAAINAVDMFKDRGFNVLYVNGPGVGCSSGYPTSYSIGAGQEAGLQFLEKVIQPKKILLYGTSLGGGAQAEAIINHKFKKDIDYMVWSDRTFDKLSNAASHMVTILAKPLFFFLGIELNGIKAAKKLQKLNITHVITQNSTILGNTKTGMTLPLSDQEFIDDGTDDVIPNKTSLYSGIKEAGIRDNKRVKCYGSSEILHNVRFDQIPDTMNLVKNDIEIFLKK